MSWIPHVTVAAIIEKENRFLLVKEISEQGDVFNQPAGHWEENETLIQAVIRETQEETAYTFVPEGLVGCYQWKIPGKQTTYLRFCFYGQVTEHQSNQELDEGIIATEWMTLDQLQAESCPKRSPLVLNCINDYLAGKRYPLEIINNNTADIW